MSAKSKQPTVSAIITTHNRAELAKKAIDSVLKQTFADIELIVVDDASELSASDSIRALAEEKGFAYIYIDPSETKGGNHARNVGVQASGGKYIAFLDDDDEWMSEKTERQIRFLEEHGDYGVVSCLRLKETDYTTRAQESEKKIEGDIRDSIFTCMPYLTSTIMIRREILFRIGLFDENLRYWQDYDLAIRYAQVTKVGCLKQPLCLYRILHKDKGRLTNNLDGWESAVRYIEDKYKSAIEGLPAHLQKKHRFMIAKDGLLRAQNAKNYRMAIRYSCEMVKLQPTIKNCMKLLLSCCNIKW